MQRPVHQLATLVHGAVADTVMSVCRCGWVSAPCRRESAVTAFEAHLRRTARRTAA